MFKNLCKFKNLRYLARYSKVRNEISNEVAPRGLWRDFDLFDPFEDIRGLYNPRDVNRAFQSFGNLDFKETKENYVLKADLPGMKKEEISISLEENSLILSGERKDEKEEKGDKFYRKERRYGKFQRVLPLPNNVDHKNIKAEFKDGVLNISIAKLNKEEPEKKMEIKIE